MRIILYIGLQVLLGCIAFFTLAQHVLTFQGQASAWANVNPGNELPLWTGARYIPQVNYGFNTGASGAFGVEASANINGSAGLQLFDSLTGAGQLKPYRVWARYATDQLEIRLGLQKINFGSAAMLRPLMWFDQVDPRDPLQLTDGVWGLLGRYYFLNNANVWLWALYGNEGPKTWETGPTSERAPEFGGRLQLPLPKGETAFSFHHRKSDQFFFPGTSGLTSAMIQPGYLRYIPENRYGFDLRLDVEAGIWAEAVWINKRKDVALLTNQQIVNMGADYTFNIGNGLHVVAEHLLFSFDHQAFQFKNRTHFSGASVSYPAGINDNISGIFYYDWTHRNLYSFANWQHQFKSFSIYLMVFINPESFQLPQQSQEATLFSGKGFQLMLVYNH